MFMFNALFLLLKTNNFAHFYLFAGRDKSLKISILRYLLRRIMEEVNDLVVEGDDEGAEEGGGDRGAGDSGGEEGGGDSGGETRSADSSDDEEQPFDITLAATHSYMGSGLSSVRGRCVLEAGWRGRVPVFARAGAVFPGETVPLLLPRSADAAALADTIRDQRKLFGLLFPDEVGMMVSGYGVLCEIFEATQGGEQDAEEGTEGALSVKARAIHRFKLVDLPKVPQPIQLYARPRVVEVRVLPEHQLGDPLQPARLASLDAHRHNNTLLDVRLRGMDAAVTPWPLFVYSMFDYPRMRRHIQDYFKTLSLESLPADPVSLSFWTASNLALAARDRLTLFTLDNALLRLHMEVGFIDMISVLCCTACMTEIARREHIFAMSSEGVHSNYTNLGGFMHDIVTVSTVSNTSLNGAPSAEFSWFPGYSWTVAHCAACMAHVGWRFKALKKSLRPQQFYGICRNYVQPRGDGDYSPFA